MKNKLFNQIENKTAFKNWILKIYFSDSKNKWFDPNINQTNVLDYIETSKNFPQTPFSLIKLWKLKNSLNRSTILKEKIDDFIESDEKETKYITGEETLKVIGKEVGNMSPMMVTKFFLSAINKVKFATKNTSIENLDEDEYNLLNEKIFKARKEACDEYVKILKSNQNNIKNILTTLHKEKYLTKNEVKLVSDTEIVELTKLSNKPTNDIIVILGSDIEKDNNIFKTYQSVVSKKFYKNRKFS